MPALISGKSGPLQRLEPPLWRGVRLSHRNGKPADRAICRRGLTSACAADRNFYRGKLQACNYYCTWELPATAPQFDLLGTVDSIPLGMQAVWY